MDLKEALAKGIEERAEREEEAKIAYAAAEEKLKEDYAHRVERTYNRFKIDDWLMKKVQEAVAKGKTEIQIDSSSKVFASSNKHFPRYIDADAEAARKFEGLRVEAVQSHYHDGDTGHMDTSHLKISW